MLEVLSPTQWTLNILQIACYCLTWEKNTVRCVSLPSSHIGNIGDFKKLPTYTYDCTTNELIQLQDFTKVKVDMGVHQIKLLLQNSSRRYQNLTDNIFCYMVHIYLLVNRCFAIYIVLTISQWDQTLATWAYNSFIL